MQNVPEWWREYHWHVSVFFNSVVTEIILTENKVYVWMGWILHCDKLYKTVGVLLFSAYP